MSDGLTDEEVMLVDTVRAFVDRDVKPEVRDIEHANTYPVHGPGGCVRIMMLGCSIEG